jgi:hypothetical protein
MPDQLERPTAEIRQGTVGNPRPVFGKLLFRWHHRIGQESQDVLAPDRQLLFSSRPAPRVAVGATTGADGADALGTGRRTSRAGLSSRRLW